MDRINSNLVRKPSHRLMVAILGIALSIALFELAQLESSQINILKPESFSIPMFLVFLCCTFTCEKAVGWLFDKLSTL